MKNFFSKSGVSNEILSEGCADYRSNATSEFLKTWDVTHKLTSSYYPMSIGRGKVAVKKATRLLRSNIDTPRILKMMDLWMQCFIPEIHPTTIVKYLRSRLYLASIWRQFFVFELFVKSSLILRCGSCGEKRISWKKGWFLRNLQEESYNHFTLVVDAW